MPRTTPVYLGRLTCYVCWIGWKNLLSADLGTPGSAGRFPSLSSFGAKTRMAADARGEPSIR